METKGIELSKESYNALLNGASKFIIPITDENICISQTGSPNYIFWTAYNFECNNCKGKDPQCTDCYGKGKVQDLDCESEEEFIKKYSSLQVEDEFEQSRFKGEITRVEVKKIQDLGFVDYHMFGMKWGPGCAWFNTDTVFTDGEYEYYDLECFKDWLEKQNVDYNQNPYVFLYTIK